MNRPVFRHPALIRQQFPPFTAPAPLRRVLLACLAVWAAGAAVAIALSPPPVAAANDNYAGSESCRACHQTEYQVWRKSKHAVSVERLPEAMRRNPQCLQCHATEGMAAAAEVGCEACHGPGRYYQQPNVMKDAALARAVGLREPTAALCVQCHTAETPALEAFDYERMWAKIAHGPKAPAAKPQ